MLDLECRGVEDSEDSEDSAIAAPSAIPDLEFDEDRISSAIGKLAVLPAGPLALTVPIDAARVVRADLGAIFQGHPVYRGLYEAPITRALAAWVAMGNP